MWSRTSRGASFWASDRAEIWDAKRWAADNEDLTADQMAELMDSLNF